MNECAIIMYHYVRDLENSRYPEIKGCSLDRFSRQLDYLQKEYELISAEDIRDCLDEVKRLPERACLLTFDDGYLEHYTEVFPELCRRGLSGCFYPPVKALNRDKLLEVNKIHLLLAKIGYGGISQILQDFKSSYEKIRVESPDLPSYEQLWLQYAIPGRFDPAEVIFFKRALQHALPPGIRKRVLDELFVSYMDAAESVLARETYISVEMLRIMAANGMHIGSHGANHLWLDKIDPPSQKKEIDLSLQMLASVYGNDKFFWSIAYPFGGYDETLKEYCVLKNCGFALTTEAEKAYVIPDKRMKLSRLDTNDVSFI